MTMPIVDRARRQPQYATMTTPTGRRVGKPIQMTGPVADIAKAVGGVDKLAELVGVDRRTVGRWADGSRSPSGPAKKILGQVAAKHGLPPPFP